MLKPIKIVIVNGIIDAWKSAANDIRKGIGERTNPIRDNAPWYFIIPHISVQKSPFYKKENICIIILSGAFCFDEAIRIMKEYIFRDIQKAVL